MADEARRDERPVLRFARGDRVRLTMTQQAVDGSQVPHHAVGTVVASLDEEGSRFEVAFHALDGREPPDDAGPPMAVAHVPVAFLQPLAPPAQADHRSDARHSQDEEPRR